MFTSELSIVIPIVMVLIFASLLMFFFASELAMAQIIPGQAFLLSAVDSGSLNGKAPAPIACDVEAPLPIRRRLDYHTRSASQNPLYPAMGPETFEFETAYTLFREHRVWFRVGTYALDRLSGSESGVLN